jgi:hypothetical protein
MNVLQRGCNVDGDKSIPMTSLSPNSPLQQLETMGTYLLSSPRANKTILLVHLGLEVPLALAGDWVPALMACQSRAAIFEAWTNQSNQR